MPAACASCSITDLYHGSSHLCARDVMASSREVLGCGQWGWLLLEKCVTSGLCQPAVPLGFQGGEFAVLSYLLLTQKGPTSTPNESCWYLNPERDSREPLNKAVNEEVSSLNLFGSPSPHPNILTSGPPLLQTLPSSEGGQSQPLASFPAPCRQCCCSQGTCTARPGCAPHPWLQNQAPPASWL